MPIPNVWSAAAAIGAGQHRPNQSQCSSTTPPESSHAFPGAVTSQPGPAAWDGLYGGQEQALHTAEGGAMDRRGFLSLGMIAAATTVVGSDSAFYTNPRGMQGDSAFSLVPARRADALCQSYCINTKLFYQASVYSHTDAVIDLLKDLGARIVRERVTTGNSLGARQQQYAMPRLADAGTRWHGTVGEIDDWRNATAANKEVMGFLSSFYGRRLGIGLRHLMHSFGGCNEVDGPVVNGHTDPRWAAHARIMQKALWRQAKANPLTRGIPVAGPSTRTDVTARRATRLGDLSAWCDRFGNAHMYNRGGSPTREIDEHLAILRRCFPDANRWIFCETGYNNSPQDNTGRTVPEAASATYAIRGICDFFKRNAIYGRFELLDDPDAINDTTQSSINRTAEREAHFGLVAMTKDTVKAATPDTWRKKPEFFATKRFLSLLSDRGSAFSPEGLRMKVTGGGPDLQRLLLQKRDGRHFLVLWRDVEVATPYPEGRSLRVRPDDVTVELLRSRPVAVYEPGRRSSRVASWSDTSRITVPLAGELKVIELG